jgi:di/tricarboxylate transporter
LLKAAEEDRVLKAMPWSAILMVTGVTVLIQRMSKIGGMDLFANIMATMSTPYTATLVVGFWSVLISSIFLTGHITDVSPLSASCLNHDRNVNDSLKYRRSYYE